MLADADAAVIIGDPALRECGTHRAPRDRPRAGVGRPGPGCRSCSRCGPLAPAAPAGTRELLAASHAHASPRTGASWSRPGRRPTSSPSPRCGPTSSATCTSSSMRQTLEGMNEFLRRARAPACCRASRSPAGVDCRTEPLADELVGVDLLERQVVEDLVVALAGLPLGGGSARQVLAGPPEGGEEPGRASERLGQHPVQLGPLTVGEDLHRRIEQLVLGDVFGHGRVGSQELADAQRVQVQVHRPLVEVGRKALLPGQGAEVTVDARQSDEAHGDPEAVELRVDSAQPCALQVLPCLLRPDELRPAEDLEELLGDLAEMIPTQSARPALP